MVDKTDAQVDAALSAAKARQAIAERIREAGSWHPEGRGRADRPPSGRSLCQPRRRAAEAEGSLRFEASAS